MRTQCALLLKNESVKDKDQEFILSEILRYFESDSSGINQFDQMNKEWKDLVLKVVSKSPLSKASEEVQNTVTAWHQEQRDVCLIMSRLTGSDVTLRLSREHRTDPAKRLKDDSDQLCKTGQLSFSLDIPNAAAPLDVTADVGSRVIYSSMKLQAAQDKKSSKARVNWLTKQLKKIDPNGFYLRANRPGRSKYTEKPLSDVIIDAGVLDSNESDVVTNSLELLYRVDLAGRFSGSKIFIEELEKAVPHFYEQAGQWLKAWTPSAPKIDKESSVEKGDSGEGSPDAEKGPSVDDKAEEQMGNPE